MLLVDGVDQNEVRQVPTAQALLVDRARLIAAMAAITKDYLERLPSGSFRVKVYAGKDPVIG